MAKASTELVKAGEASEFAVLRMEPNELVELIQENLGGDTITARDLDRVKVPSGGGQVWEVPSIDGTDAVKSIEGVIVHRTTRRAYWPNKYEGGGEQPDCASDDGVQGIGDPGGPCGECPFNEFGSGRDGIGKACKEVRQLFVVTEDSLIPIVINVPPASLANVKAYFLRLMRVQLRPTDVVTHIGLEKAQSKTDITFSRVTLTAGPRLEPEAAARLKQYADILQPAFARTQVRRDDIEEDE